MGVNESKRNSHEARRQRARIRERNISYRNRAEILGVPVLILKVLDIIYATFLTFIIGVVGFVCIRIGLHKFMYVAMAAVGLPLVILDTRIINAVARRIGEDI